MGFTEIWTWRLDSTYQKDWGKNKFLKTCPVKYIHPYLRKKVQNNLLNVIIILFLGKGQFNKMKAIRNCTSRRCCHQKLCHIYFDWQHLWWIHRLYIRRKKEATPVHCKNWKQVSYKCMKIRMLVQNKFHPIV